MNEPDEALTTDSGVRARETALERKRRRRRRVLVPLVFLTPVLLLAAGAYAWWHIQLDPIGSPGAAVAVTVPDGWGVRDIAKELSHRDVISSSFAFDVYVRLKHKGPFEAGDYHFRKNLGVADAVRTLEKGPVIRYLTLRVPPGLWLREVAAKVHAQMPALSAAKFLAIAQSDQVRSKYEPKNVHTLEGLLFPDTYKFTTKDGEIDVVRTMVKRFDAVGDSIDLAGANVPGSHAVPGRRRRVDGAG